jgi:hexokinase
VFTKYPHFATRLQQALIEIFGEEIGNQIVMKGAEDGSGSVINLFSPQLRSADRGVCNLY